MAIGSGLASQIGGKKESVYGTTVVPDHFWEFRTETFVRDQDYLQSTQLRAGRMYPSASRRTPTTRRSTGAVTMEVPNKGFGFFLDLMHDSVVAPVQQGATAAYKQSHPIGTNGSRKSATIQVGKPDSSGVVRPFTGAGAVLSGWTFDCDLGEFLTSALTFDVRDLISTPGAANYQALATPSYPTDLRGFNFAQGLVTLDGDAAAKIRGFTINGGSAMKTDRFVLNRTGLKDQPIHNAYAAGEGTLRVEFASMALYNRFVNNERAAVVLDFEGPEIAVGQPEKLAITLGSVGWEGTTPQVDGPDVVDHEMQMRIGDAGSGPPILIDYYSTDTAL